MTLEDVGSDCVDGDGCALEKKLPNVSPPVVVEGDDNGGGCVGTLCPAPGAKSMPRGMFGGCRVRSMVTIDMML